MHRFNATTTRRKLLAGAAMFGAAGLIGELGMARLARATIATQSQRRFILCYFGGGWDQLLFLDPRDTTANNGEFADANAGTTGIQTDYGSLAGYQGFTGGLHTGGKNLVFGPAAIKPDDGAPKITDHADRIAIVRGLNMNTVGHEIGYRYFLTCRPPQGSAAKGTSLPVELAGQMASMLPIPSLSLQLEAYNTTQAGMYSSVQVNSVADLVSVLDRSVEKRERDAVEEALAAYERGELPCSVQAYDRSGVLTAMQQVQGTARTLLKQGFAQRFAFVHGNDEDSQQVRAQYGFSQGDGGSPGARAALAAQAVKQQVSQCVSVHMGVGLDSHGGDNRAHAGALYPAVAALAALIDDLAKSPAPADLQAMGGATWLDHTTILAFSEFARAPLFADGKTTGRDHHICSSVLLAGAGIVGDRMVGATGYQMKPYRYDFAARKTLPEEAASGENIKPEHIAATMLASAGLEYNLEGLRVEPIWELVAGA